MVLLSAAYQHNAPKTWLAPISKAIIEPHFAIHYISIITVSECSHGTFGENCNQNCSVNCQLETCDVKSEQCLCKAGYKGDMCQNGSKNFNKH